jgi:hypothetical protein
MVKFQQEPLMWNHIKGLAEVHYDNVSLLPLVEGVGEVICCQDQLGLARSISAKAMLFVGQN